MGQIRRERVRNECWKIQLDCGEWELVGSLRKFQVSPSQHHYTDVLSLPFRCSSKKHSLSLHEVLLGNFKVATCAPPAQTCLIISGEHKGSFYNLASKMEKNEGSSSAVALEWLQRWEAGKVLWFLGNDMNQQKHKLKCKQAKKVNT